MIDLIALALLGIGAVVVLIFLGMMVYIVKEWERVALLRFGRIVKIVETGIHFKIPIMDSLIRIDMRTQTVDLRGQMAITKDNISLVIDAVVFIKVEDPKRTILQVRDFKQAVANFAQTAIRDIVGTYDLDYVLEQRDEIAGKLKEAVDSLSKEWGIDTARAGLQDISLPEDMKRAFAVQAEAERESRAVIIKAEAELKAAEKLAEAAELMKDPNAMQLRILQTLNDISKDQSNTLVFALPLESIKSLDLGGAAAMTSAGMKKKIE